MTGAEYGLCTAPADPMQALLDQIAELQSQLAQCQAGAPTTPPVDESDDDSRSDRRSRRNRD